MGPATEARAMRRHAIGRATASGAEWIGATRGGRSLAERKTFGGRTMADAWRALDDDLSFERMPDGRHVSGRAGTIFGRPKVPPHAEFWTDF